MQCVNQPKLTAGRQPVTSRGKGNPMKDHARHVPGSTPSRRTAFPRSAPPARRSEPFKQNADKIQTKCSQNREGNFFNICLSTTYNFNAVKCLNFLPRSALTATLNLTRTRGLNGHTSHLPTCLQSVRLPPPPEFWILNSCQGCRNLSWTHCSEMNILSTKMNTCGGGGCSKTGSTSRVNACGCPSSPPFLGSSLPHRRRSQNEKE